MWQLFPTFRPRLRLWSLSYFKYRCRSKNIFSMLRSKERSHTKLSFKTNLNVDEKKKNHDGIRIKQLAEYKDVKIKTDLILICVVECWLFSLWWSIVGSFSSQVSTLAKDYCWHLGLGHFLSSKKNWQFYI